MPVEKLECSECGMSLAIREYHPYAACLMFKACRNETKVRENLDAVTENAQKQPTAEPGGVTWNQCDEAWREYVFPSGVTIRFEGVTEIGISESRNQRRRETNE